MADEEKNEETPETEAVASEAPDTDAAPEPASEEAPVPAEAAEEPAPAAEAPAAEAPAAEPAEVVAPKERRRRVRAAKSAAEAAKPERSPEERQAERVAERRRKQQVRRGTRLRAREKARARKGDARETPARESEPGKQKTRQGIVVSDRAEKTITVRIDTSRRHRRYEKIVRTSRTLHAHDELSEAGVGDTVIVRESRPLSRSKRWRLVRVLEKAE